MRKMNAQLATVVVLALSTTQLPTRQLRAQDVRRDSRVRDAVNLLDRWVDAQQAYEQFPGISMAVVHDQTLVWAGGFGLADVESGRPATPQTVYSICSISKLFTSIAAMRLVDQGLLDLDRPIDQVLPWFRVAAGPAESELLSLWTLLTHTSGLEEDIGTPPDTAPHLYWATREKLRTLLPGEELRHGPGSAYVYSLGMAIIGEVVTEVSGQPFEDYVTEEILQPLGMWSTSPEIGTVWESGRVATGYGPLSRGGGRRTLRPFSGNGMAPAMGFASTVLDLARFSSWQFRLLDGRDEILSAGTLREMYRPQFADSAGGVTQGLGFAIHEDGADRFVGHAGFCAGFQSDLLIDPEGRLAAIALANSMIPAWDYTSMAHKLIGPAIDAAVSDPEGSEPTPEDLHPYIGTYEGFPWSGEWQVIPWAGSLAIIHLPVDDPTEVLRPLEQVAAGHFRVVEANGSLGMHVTFEADAGGAIVRMVTDDYPRPRIR